MPIEIYAELCYYNLQKDRIKWGGWFQWPSLLWKRPEQTANKRRMTYETRKACPLGHLIRSLPAALLRGSVDGLSPWSKAKVSSSILRKGIILQKHTSEKETCSHASRHCSGLAAPARPGVLSRSSFFCVSLHLLLCLLFAPLSALPQGRPA